MTNILLCLKLVFLRLGTQIQLNFKRIILEFKMAKFYDTLKIQKNIFFLVAAVETSFILKCGLLYGEHICIIASYRNEFFLRYYDFYQILP